MIVFICNANDYKGEEELLLEEINSLDQPQIICFYGEMDFYRKLKEFSPNLEIVYLGYSPISDEKLIDFLSIVFFVNNIPLPIIVNYIDNNAKKIDCDSTPIYDAFSAYVNGMKDVELFINSLKVIKELLTFDGYFRPISFIDKILGYIDYDSLILSIYTSKFSYCSYNAQNKNYYDSLNNKTIIKDLKKIADDNYKNNENWLLLKSVLDDYLSFSSKNNERASILYIALFNRMSSFYKNNHQSIIAYSVLLRSLEVAATFILIKRNSIITAQDRITFKADGSDVAGVGSLISHLKLVISDFDYIKIYKLIQIRNNSLLGHRFYSPELADYDECYQAVNLLIKKILSDKDESKFYDKSLKAFSFSKMPLDILREQYNAALEQQGEDIRS